MKLPTTAKLAVCAAAATATMLTSPAATGMASSGPDGIGHSIIGSHSGLGGVGHSIIGSRHTPRPLRRS